MFVDLVRRSLPRRSPLVSSAACPFPLLSNRPIFPSRPPSASFSCVLLLRPPPASVLVRRSRQRHRCRAPMTSLLTSSEATWRPRQEAQVRPRTLKNGAGKRRRGDGDGTGRARRTLGRPRGTVERAATKVGGFWRCPGVDLRRLRRLAGVEGGSLGQGGAPERPSSAQVGHGRGGTGDENAYLLYRGSTLRRPRLGFC